MLLGSGELGKEVLIALQRLGVETIAVDRYANAPGQQVAHHARTITMSDPAALRALILAEKPDLIVPEIEAIATAVLEELEAEGLVRVIPTARAARLTLQVSPGPHQARALVLEPRELHLQLALARAGPPPEDLQDQPRAIHDLAGPGLLQIALLHGRERVVDQDHVEPPRLDHYAELLDLALAEQRRRGQCAERRDRRFDEVQVQRLGQPDRLQQPRGGIAQVRVRGPDRVQNQGGFLFGPPVDEFARSLRQSISLSSEGS